MRDLISTQESVAKIVDTAIRKILSGEQKLTKEYEQSVIDAVDVILNTARREAQPEIIRCKDCKHKPTGSGVNHDINFPKQDYRCPCRCEAYWYSWMPDDDWFCANGERREDETD